MLFAAAPAPELVLLRQPLDETSKRRLVRQWLPQVGKEARKHPHCPQCISNW
jgi:hypothetical protein